MRYSGESKIPEGLTEKEEKDLEETLREFEHEFAFFEKFGEKALLIWKELNERRGYKKGEYLREKYKIEGSGINAVARLIESYMDDDPERTARPDIEVQGDRLIVESTGFCPLLESAKILDIDMKYTCPYSTRPYFLAMCRAVNPNVKHRNTKWRAKGDKVCQEIFWIEE